MFAGQDPEREVTKPWLLRTLGKQVPPPLLPLPHPPTKCFSQPVEKVETPPSTLHPLDSFFLSFGMPVLIVFPPGNNNPQKSRKATELSAASVCFCHFFGPPSAHPASRDGRGPRPSRVPDPSARRAPSPVPLPFPPLPSSGGLRAGGAGGGSGVLRPQGRHPPRVPARPPSPSPPSGSIPPSVEPPRAADRTPRVVWQRMVS